MIEDKLAIDNMDRKVAIVTGASSGIGAALCHYLVVRGWNVAMADTKPNDKLRTELGDHAQFYETDVASYSSQAQTFQTVFTHYGRLDAVCANAGIVDHGSLYLLDHKSHNAQDVPPEPDLTCTDVNYKGVVYGTHLAIHFMRKNPVSGGSIVATSSIAALHPHPSYPEYNGSKAAVLNFVRGVSKVLSLKEDIRINTVLPGIVSTDIVPAEMIEAVSPEWYEILTPVTTVIRAIVALLEDGMSAGQAIECSAEKQIVLPPNPFQNGDITKRAVTVWEPLFNVIHHERSGLVDAIP